MAGPMPLSGTQSPLSVTDPNALLQHIDQTMTMTYHWVRAGVIVIIILVLAVAIGL
ncbi:MAG TPA: hypothetical protein VEE83_04280 [Thermoplasmata archaeon]|nr:hypothetical protein [Thermoplasmata archaeon]